MEEKRSVELVRVEREEEYFDREEVLGRDTSSVFPTEAKKSARLDPRALAAAIGGSTKFISATELEEIKKKRGLSVEDGTLAPSKPLAEVLQEAKDKKQQEFADMWKKMKEGKNRPLDEDELEFLDHVASAAAEQERAVRQQEEDELAAFHEALRQQQEAKGPEQGPVPKPQPAAPAHKSQHKRPLVTVKPKAKPGVLIVKPSSDAARANHGQQPDSRDPDVGQQPRDAGSNGGAEQQQPSKRQKADAAAAGAQQAGAQGLEEEVVGLPGLLGGYGSDSSDGGQGSGA